MPRDSFAITEKGDGLSEWIAELRDMERGGADLKDKLDRAAHRTTELMRAAMPRRTGALAASGHYTSHMAGDIYEAEVRFGDGLDYGVFVVGQHVNGRHAWDDAWRTGQALFAEVVAEEFPGVSERSL